MSNVDKLLLFTGVAGFIVGMVGLDPGLLKDHPVIAITGGACFVGSIAIGLIKEYVKQKLRERPTLCGRIKAIEAQIDADPTVDQTNKAFLKGYYRNAILYVGLPPSINAFR